MSTRATVRFIHAASGLTTAKVGILQDGDPKSVRELFLRAVMPDKLGEATNIMNLPVLFITHLQNLGVPCALLGDMRMTDAEHDYEVTITESLNPVHVAFYDRKRLILRHVQSDMLLEVIEFDS